MELGEREIIYLSLHCHHQNDFCIKMGSDGSYFNVSVGSYGQSRKTVSTILSRPPVFFIPLSALHLRNGVVIGAGFLSSVVYPVLNILRTLTFLVHAGLVACVPAVWCVCACVRACVRVCVCVRVKL